MSVGLLAVQLFYRFYVVGHLSKWFTFLSFLVVCLMLSGRLLRLHLTFCSYPKGGTFTTKLDLKN